jgi:hypothetical protein
MKRMPRWVAVAAIALTSATPAFAQIPTVAGDYVEISRIYCQPVVNVQQSKNGVTALALSETAPTSFSMALEYYDPRTTIVTKIGYSETGSAVLLNDSQSGVSGTPIAEKQHSDIFFYSNDLNTLTVNGVIYRVTWGTLKNTVLFTNVPMYFSLVAIDSNGCIRQSEHVRR